QRDRASAHVSADAAACAGRGPESQGSRRAQPEHAETDLGGHRPGKLSTATAGTREAVCLPGASAASALLRRQASRAPPGFCRQARLPWFTVAGTAEGRATCILIASAMTTRAHTSKIAAVVNELAMAWVRIACALVIVSAPGSAWRAFLLTVPNTV